MVQAGEPRGDNEPAPRDGAAGTPRNPEKSEKDAAPQPVTPPDGDNPTEVIRVLDPTVLEALRAAAATRTPAAAPAEPAPGTPADEDAEPSQTKPEQPAAQTAPNAAMTAPTVAMPTVPAPKQPAPGQATPKQPASGQAAPEQLTPEPVGPNRAAPSRAVPEQVAPKRVVPKQAGPEVAAADGFVGEAGGGAPETDGRGYLRTGKIGKFAGSRSAKITAGIASALVVVFCLACSGVFGSLAKDPASPLADASAGPGAAAEAASPTATAPRPATKPVRAAGDLDAVCGNTYFPTAPKYSGKGPHPVVISAKERLDLGARSARTLNKYAFSGSAAAKKTWAPVAKQAQIVACLDLIGGGAKVADCKTDVASAPKMPLMVGRYKLTVYEVATGRKLTEASLNGAGKACPWVVLTGSDPTLYTTVDDAQLFKALQAKVK